MVAGWPIACYNGTKLFTLIVTFGLLISLVISFAEGVCRVKFQHACFLSWQSIYQASHQ